MDIMTVLFTNANTTTNTVVTTWTTGRSGAVKTQVAANWKPVPM